MTVFLSVVEISFKKKITCTLFVNVVSSIFVSMISVSFYGFNESHSFKDIYHLVFDGTTKFHVLPWISHMFSFTLDFSYFLVNKKGEVSESVQKVLKQEMDKLYFGKDAKTLNSEFMDRNNNSILHRLAGLSRRIGFMAKIC